MSWFIPLGATFGYAAFIIIVCRFLRAVAQVNETPIAQQLHPEPAEASISVAGRAADEPAGQGPDNSGRPSIASRPYVQGERGSAATRFITSSRRAGNRSS